MLITNSSYGYQIVDCSQYSVKKYMNDDTTHAAIKNKLFKRLRHINDQIYEKNFAKSEIEHKKTNHCRLLYPAAR